MVLTQSQIQDIKEILKVNIKSLINDKAFLTSIANEVAAIVEEKLQKSFDEIHGKVLEMNNKIATLELQNNQLTRDNLKIQLELDNLQQYSRRNNIRIFGIKEEAAEDTHKVVLNMFSEKLKLKIDESAIDRTHRVGGNTSKNRHLIVKFVSYQTRAQIILNRKLLKGTGITVTEDLTVRRLVLLKTAKQKVNKENAWSRDGNIWIKFNNVKRVIKEEAELDALK